jgi:serine/threonine protein kinase
MEPSIESFCNSLARSRLLAPEQVWAMYQRCRQEAPEACTDLARFVRWVVAAEYLTEYQAGIVQRGNADQLILGPYKVLERIGRGRMAGVYKAQHQLGQVVAVKVLPPSKARDPHILGRFQREARLALRLKHPNIVRTFQTGDWEGRHCLVMEYLEGETLEEVLARRGKLPAGEAVRLVCQALTGLQQIHDEGLVHRDFKPANLMLVGGDAGSTLGATVKILDIGLGRALFDEDPSGKAQNFELTNEGELLGTPAYMAPEQARDSHSADIRADVYSLGCTLYHALAGQPPFADANPARQLIRHATERPRPLADFSPGLPRGLQEVVGEMLAKDPSQRPATPERAAVALRPFLSAGAEVMEITRQPRMAAYLKWLEAQFGKDAAPRTPPPVRKSPRPAPQPPPAPRPARPVPPAPAPRASSEAPTAPPQAPPRSAPPPATVVEVLEEVQPRKRLRHVDVEPVASVPAHSGPEQSPGGLSHRDLLMIAAGVAAVSVVAVVVAAVVFLLSR